MEDDGMPIREDQPVSEEPETTEAGAHWSADTVVGVPETISAGVAKSA